MRGERAIAHAANLGALAIRGRVPPGEEDKYGWLAVAASLFDGDIPSWLTQAFDSSVVLQASVAIRDVLQRTPAEELSAAVEQHLTASDLGTQNGRRRSGAYYTPRSLTEFVVEQTVGPLAARVTTTEDLLAIRVFDPAVGCGDFLLAALRLLAARAVELSGGDLSIEHANRLLVEGSIYGSDINPVAALMTSGILHRKAGGGGCQANIQWADTLLDQDSTIASVSAARGIDLSSWLGSGGHFDVVIGNPPWGPVKPAIRRFLAHSHPTALERQGADLREALQSSSPGVALSWEDHAERARTYAAALRDSGVYHHQGSGDADLYRYFVERAHSLVGSSGRLGLIVPGGILRADGATPLRRMLLDSGTIEVALELINNKRLFAIHTMFRFAVLVWQGGPRRGIRRVAFGLKDSKDASRAIRSPALSLSTPYLRRVGGDRLSIPDVRSRADAALLERLYGTHPPLEQHGVGSWNVQFVRELDMSNDSKHFQEASKLALMNDPVPLYEGRMVQQFDDRAKRYESGSGRRAVWVPQGLGIRLIQPHFYVERVIANRFGAGVPRSGFCDVTGHANERTMLASLIPADAVAGNKVPTTRFDPDSPDLPFLWTGLFNSFVLDWVARRRVSTTLNFFQLLQLPFPRIDPASKAGMAIVVESRALCSSLGEWTSQELRSRSRHRAQVDAEVASIFRLSLEDLVHILSDFPLLDRYQPEPERISSTVTRDLLLSTFAGSEMVTLNDLELPSDGGPSNLWDRVHWAEEQGQLAYVPGETAKVLFSGSRLASKPYEPAAD